MANLTDLTKEVVFPGRTEWLPKWLSELESAGKTKHLIVLRGFIGPSSDGKGFRIYFDTDLRRYVEIADSQAVPAFVNVVPKSGLHYVWLEWDANTIQYHHGGSIGIPLPGQTELFNIPVRDSTDAIMVRGYLGLVDAPDDTSSPVNPAPPTPGTPSPVGLPTSGTPAAGAGGTAAAAAPTGASATATPAGGATAAAYFRLYFDVGLTHYIEIPSKNFRYGVRLNTNNSPLELCYIWIDRDADVTEYRTEVNRSYKAGLLEGVVVQDYLGGRVSAGPDDDTPAKLGQAPGESGLPGCPPSIGGCPSAPNCPG